MLQIVPGAVRAAEAELIPGRRRRRRRSRVDRGWIRRLIQNPEQDVPAIQQVELKVEQRDRRDDHDQYGVGHPHPHEAPARPHRLRRRHLSQPRPSLQIPGGADVKDQDRSQDSSDLGPRQRPGQKEQRRHGEAREHVQRDHRRARPRPDQVTGDIQQQQQGVHRDHPVRERSVQRRDALHREQRNHREDVGAREADVVQRPPARAVAAPYQVGTPDVQVPGQRDHVQVEVRRVQVQHVVRVVPQPNVLEHVPRDVRVDPQSVKSC